MQTHILSLFLLSLFFLTIFGNTLYKIKGQCAHGAWEEDWSGLVPEHDGSNPAYLDCSYPTNPAKDGKACAWRIIGYGGVKRVCKKDSCPCPFGYFYARDDGHQGCVCAQTLPSTSDGDNLHGSVDW